MRRQPIRMIIVLFMVLIVMTRCETIIHPTLETAQPVLVVDAWLTNIPGPQRILLTKTQPYFENVLPPGVSGASVLVTDDVGGIFDFIEDDNSPGTYVWTPPTPGDAFGTIGLGYRLQIQVDGQTYEATARMGRVPAIDSITFETDKRVGDTDSLTRAEFWATDPAGKGDAYWIRSYKNGTLLNKPSEINIAYDAGFSIGGPTDGVTFITPIRRRINPNDKDADDRTLNPFVSGDSINVQIHSITEAAFTYLNEVSIQTNRPGGFQELFSTPLANVSTNLLNTQPQGPQALGFFNVSAVTSAGKRYIK